MTDERLAEARETREMIDKCKKHLTDIDYLIRMTDNGFKLKQVFSFITAKGGTYTGHTEMYDDVTFMQPLQFLQLYRTSLLTKISTLEKEFAEL